MFEKAEKKQKEAEVGPFKERKIAMAPLEIFWLLLFQCLVTLAGGQIQKSLLHPSLVHLLFVLFLVAVVVVAVVEGERRLVDPLVDQPLDAGLK